MCSQLSSSIFSCLSLIFQVQKVPLDWNTSHLAEEKGCHIFHRSLSAILFWDSPPSQKWWTLLFQSIISFVSLLNSLSLPNKLQHIYISIMDNGPDVVCVTETWQSEILPSPQFWLYHQVCIISGHPGATAVILHSYSSCPLVASYVSSSETLK